MNTPLYHQTGSKWRPGLPWWWFGAPVIAFIYTALTPRFLPDIVPVESAPRAVRWLVGLVAGVVLLTAARLVIWVVARIHDGRYE